MSGESPAVSVVMPVWRPDSVFFAEALSSVLRQTMTDFELIIVEDPSEQSAAAAVGDAADPRIRYFANSSRTSIVEQHNRGVALARSALVARFDSDDVCEPDRLRRQKEFLDRHPEVGVISSQLVVIDEAGRTLGSRRYPTDPAAVHAAFRRYNPIANPAVMFRKKIVDVHGGWTQGANGVARDYAWFSHLAAAGVVFANLDTPLVRYRLHGATLKRRKLRETAQTTWDVKREIWLAEMTLADKLVMIGERLVTLLPGPLVLDLFRRFRITRAEPAD
ncbi:MAG: glycosyltransferase [Thermoanaerobaculia bacterium]